MDDDLFISTPWGTKSWKLLREGMEALAERDKLRLVNTELLAASQKGFDFICAVGRSHEKNGFQRSGEIAFQVAAEISNVIEKAKKA